MHEGKRYRRVQIEGTDEEFLMDDEQNIYDMNLKQVGKAGDSDDEAWARDDSYFLIYILHLNL